MRMNGMNTVRKGYRAEYKVRQYLSNLGYDVDFKARRKFSANTDIFGLWDVVAIKDGQVLFVQVKTNRNGVYDFKRKSKDWLIKYSNNSKNCVVFSVVLVQPRQPFIWYKWNGLEWVRSEEVLI